MQFVKPILARPPPLAHWPRLGSLAQAEQLELLATLPTRDLVRLDASSDPQLGRSKQMACSARTELTIVLNPDASSNELAWCSLLGRPPKNLSFTCLDQFTNLDSSITLAIASLFPSLTTLNICASLRKPAQLATTTTHLGALLKHYTRQLKSLSLWIELPLTTTDQLDPLWAAINSLRALTSLSLDIQQPGALVTKPIDLPVLAQLVDLHFASSCYSAWKSLLDYGRDNLHHIHLSTLYTPAQLTQLVSRGLALRFLELGAHSVSRREHLGLWAHFNSLSKLTVSLAPHEDVTFLQLLTSLAPVSTLKLLRVDIGARAHLFEEYELLDVGPRPLLRSVAQLHLHKDWLLASQGPSVLIGELDLAPLALLTPKLVHLQLAIKHVVACDAATKQQEDQVARALLGPLFTTHSSLTKAWVWFGAGDDIEHAYIAHYSPAEFKSH